MSVVGVYRDEETARAALRRLDAAGFDPDAVGIIAGNVRQAREAAGSSSGVGALVGGAVGIAGVAALLVGDATMRENGVAIALGLVGLVAAGGFIGGLAGRARLFNRAEYEVLENEIERGDALVTIRCAGEACERARDALRTTGAVAVHEEPS